MKKLTLITSLIYLGFCSCSDFHNSNLLDSDNYNTREKRIECLKYEIKAKSDFENAEFELFNVNGFTNSRPTSIPGASSWDYKFVIRVKSSDINKWTEGMQKTQPTNYDISWTKAIVEKRASDWQTTSQPEFFKRKTANVMVIVFRNEGIIYKRVIAN
ncbi:hypothetical protein [Winogradskyella psychrotolerans]|uniref:hypothetical protein n=1 Tax=Winogradskyella psychrotolerans TaxID=1344585 RepID=UPI001C076A36|nr:hypothetical protein [Winogradskyella psychrotolerans]MBU2926702.1 hypothetical protein [Winogradskyella psychrotolerans]